MIQRKRRGGQGGGGKGGVRRGEGGKRGKGGQVRQQRPPLTVRDGEKGPGKKHNTCLFFLMFFFVTVALSRRTSDSLCPLTGEGGEGRNKTKKMLNQFLSPVGLRRVGVSSRHRISLVFMILNKIWMSAAVKKIHKTKTKLALENIPTGKDEQLHFSSDPCQVFSLGYLQDDGLLKETSRTG